MTDPDERSNPDSSKTGNQSARKWVAKSVPWVSKTGGKALGHSVRAMKKTVAVVEGAQRAATQAIKASGKAGDALLVSTADLLPLQISIGNRIRTRKRIQRLQKQSARLKKKIGLKVAAALDAGQAKLAENVEVRKLSEAVRLRAPEIAKLKDRLKKSRAHANTQAVSKGAKRTARAVAATPATAPESAVTGEAAATENLTHEPPEVEGPVVEGHAAGSAAAEAPVVDEPVTEPLETKEPVAERPGGRTYQ